MSLGLVDLKRVRGPLSRWLVAEPPRLRTLGRGVARLFGALTVLLDRLAARGAANIARQYSRLDRSAAGDGTDEEI